MTPKSLEILTIAFGAVACAGSLAMSLYFARTKAGIGRAVAGDKFAEFINMAVILAFSVAYYMGWFQVMPIYYAAALRMLAIIATLFSSIHLAYQTQKILEGRKHD